MVVGFNTDTHILDQAKEIYFKVLKQTEGLDEIKRW